MENIISVNEKRLEDLILLTKIRNYKKHLWLKKELKNILFIFAISLSHLEEASALAKFVEFNNTLNCKSKIYFKSIITRIPSYCEYFKDNGKCIYELTNDKIINLINLSDDEMLSMNYIISSDFQKLRDEERLISELEKIRLETEIEKSIIEYRNNEIYKACHNQIVFDYANEECEVDDA